MRTHPIPVKSLCLAAAALFLAGSALADDHGNTPATATGITTDGVPLAGNVEVMGDVDFFRFTATASRLYSIETSGLGPLSDTYLRLFASDGFTVLAEDDQGGSEENASRIIHPATADGPLYVEVSQYFLSGTGTYSLSVQDLGNVPEDDHGNTAASSTLVSIGEPEPGEHEIAGDIDFFSFVPQAGNFYDIETRALTLNSDTFITLYDHNGTTPLAGDDQGGREQNASRILWRAPSTDAFHVSVVQFLTSGTGGYELLVSDLGPPREAPTSGAGQAGTIEAPGDVDPFVFPGLKGHTYSLSITDTFVGGFKVLLLEADGLTVQAQSPPGTPVLEFSCGETRPHWVLVREDIAGGDYLFHVSDNGLPPPQADFDFSGRVGPEDLLIMMDLWHTETETSPGKTSRQGVAGGGER